MEYNLLTICKVVVSNLLPVDIPIGGRAGGAAGSSPIFVRFIYG